MIDLERLSTIKKLYVGAHSPDGKMCAMEAVAFIAREPWSDNPNCACPVLSAFMRVWNDALPFAERNTFILPLLPRLVGTRGSSEIESRRSLLAADWLVSSVHTSAWLRLDGLTAQADSLSNLPKIVSFAAWAAAQVELQQSGLQLINRMLEAV